MEIYHYWTCYFFPGGEKANGRLLVFNDLDQRREAIEAAPFASEARHGARHGAAAGAADRDAAAAAGGESGGGWSVASLVADSPGVHGPKKEPKAGPLAWVFVLEDSSGPS